MSSALRQISVAIPNFDLTISCNPEDGPKVRRFFHLSKTMLLPDNRNRKFPLREITAYFRKIMMDVDAQVPLYKTAITILRSSSTKIKFKGQKILNNTTIAVINETDKTLEVVYNVCIREISNLIEISNTLDLEKPSDALALENIQKNLATIESITNFINKIYPLSDETDTSMEACAAPEKDATMHEAALLKELECEALTKSSMKSKKTKKPSKKTFSDKLVHRKAVPFTPTKVFEGGSGASNDVSTSSYGGVCAAPRTSELPDTFHETVRKFNKLIQDLRESCAKFKKTVTLAPRVKEMMLSPELGLARRRTETSTSSYSDAEIIEAHYFPIEMLPLMLHAAFSRPIDPWVTSEGEHHKRRQLIISVDGKSSILEATINPEGNLYHFSSRSPRNSTEATLLRNCAQCSKSSDSSEGEFLTVPIKGVSLNEQGNAQFMHAGRTIIVYQMKS